MERKLNLTEAQLFVDDRWIGESIRVQRVMHQPDKRPQPVLQADRPWEGGSIHAYGTALYRNGCFHLWYVTANQADHGSMICYAYSYDGCCFEKPNLGLFRYRGSTANNICLTAGQPGSGSEVPSLPEASAQSAAARIDNIGVIEDDDPEWPLKAVFWQNAAQCHGLWAVRSRDGIHWDYQPGYVLPQWHDRTDAAAQKIAGKYVIICRPAEAAAPGRNRYLSRHAYRAESADLINWSYPQLILKQDVEDPPELEIYSAEIFQYESMYLGFIEIMHTVPDKFTVELMHSRDSCCWHRMHKRDAFIDCGPKGSFDAGHVNALSNGVIRHKNQLWIYYSGRSYGHSGAFPLNSGAIGLAVLRPDGFVSLKGCAGGSRTGNQEGWVATPVFMWDDLELQVNVDPRGDQTADPKYCTGEVRVEVRDAADQPISGFHRADCIPLRENTSARKTAEGLERPEFATVCWHSGASMRSLAGQRIKLVFYLRDAHLYSFRGAVSANL